MKLLDCFLLAKEFFFFYIVAASREPRLKVLPNASIAVINFYNSCLPF